MIGDRSQRSCFFWNQLVPSGGSTETTVTPFQSAAFHLFVYCGKVKKLWVAMPILRLFTQCAFAHLALSLVFFLAIEENLYILSNDSLRPIACAASEA